MFWVTASVRTARCPFSNTFPPTRRVLVDASVLEHEVGYISNI